MCITAQSAEQGSQQRDWDTLNPAPLVCLCICFLVLGTEAKALHVLNKHAATELFTEGF